ncbi:MAG: hypothetical protein Q8Q73_05650 [Stagnimonas sp.]|nr:hypothetical protein [Stagnimonas sp.]
MTPLIQLLLLVLGFTALGLAAVYYRGLRQAPGRDRFVCAHCASPSQHNERTLEAQRNGKAKFFCEQCHGEWAHQHSAPPLAYQAESGRAGCLGTTAALLLVPALLLGGSYLLG